MLRKSNFTGIILVFALAVGRPAGATDGYFMIGYGAKNVALGGATVSFPQDRLAAASNPAGMALVPAGWDFGLRSVSGFREAQLDCRGIGACDTVVADRSNRDLFIVPNGGWNKHASEQLSFGISVYGNGGINTSYGRPLYDQTIARIRGLRPGVAGYPAQGKLGADFTQLYFAPTVAWRFTPRHSVGIAPLVNVQRFSARGLQSFANLSLEPSSVSNRQTEYDLGIGVRLGWISELMPGVRFGAQYTTRNWVTALDKYEGLLAEGEFDAPPNWSLGLSWDVNSAFTVAFDFQRILFGDIKALANPGPSTAELLGTIAPERRFGAADGIGFGWIDQDVYKLGVRYRVNERLTLRTGWNHATSQIPDRESLINIVAPATINDNVAIGAGWRFAAGELNVTYTHAFKTVNHDPSSELFGVPIKIWIYEHFLDLSWSRDF